VELDQFGESIGPTHDVIRESPRQEGFPCSGRSVEDDLFLPVQAVLPSLELILGHESCTSCEDIAIQGPLKRPARRPKGSALARIVARAYTLATRGTSASFGAYKPRGRRMSATVCPGGCGVDPIPD